MHEIRALLVGRRIHIRSEVHRRAPDVPVRAGAHALGDVNVAEAETTSTRTIEEEEAPVFGHRWRSIDRVAVDRCTEVDRRFPVARQALAVRHPDVVPTEAARSEEHTSELQ